MLSYVFKTGFRNLGNKKLFSFASIGTIASSVLIFCIFFVLATNIRGIIKNVETTVGIQVFFNSNLSEEEIQNLANEKFRNEYVKSMKFKSSNEAWEKFKVDYFDNKPELAKAFEDDNPLASSASYEILLNDITKQIEYVNYLKTIEGVRQVNYSNVLIDALTSLNVGISTFSMILISLLLIIAMILISNTISLASQFRRKENSFSLKNEELFFKLVRDSFRQKRKTIRNNLNGYDLNIIEDVLSKYGYDLSVRAEALGIDIFVDIANNLTK